MPRGIPLAGKRAPGAGGKREKAGRPPSPPELRKPTISFRAEPDVARNLEEYQASVDNSRSSTLNAALRLYLEMQDLPTHEYERIQAILRKCLKR